MASEHSHPKASNPKMADKKATKKNADKSPSFLDVTEQKRLNDARETGIPWKKWGPYLSERQWGTVREDREILAGARALEESGAFAVVLEGMRRALAARISGALGIPTIGIGAGPECGGQVLVLHDLLGLWGGHRPKFAKRYAACGEEADRAVRQFCAEVRGGVFPDEEHSFD